MPFANHRGQRIHYTVEGSGPLIVLQHGLLLDAASWKQCGVVDALADRFRVVCVDSLGHGLSDKPDDPALYNQAQRAGDIVSVIDDLGGERAHVVGHSMGGWVAVGVARFFPTRLASLAIGGWDFLTGLPRGNAGPLTYGAFITFARRTVPELAEWVTPDLEGGVRACFNALGQVDGAKDAVLSSRVPVLLWNGQDDGPHAPMQRFAAENGLDAMSVPGDHLGALLQHGAAIGRGIGSFVGRG
ncbi:alpha/beta fold hydrolase [Bradyrhizobium sp. USDA 3364]